MDTELQAHLPKQKAPRPWPACAELEQGKAVHGPRAMDREDRTGPAVQAQGPMRDRGKDRAEQTHGAWERGWQGGRGRAGPSTTPGRLTLLSALHPQAWPSRCWPLCRPCSACTPPSTL